MEKAGGIGTFFLLFFVLITCYTEQFFLFLSDTVKKIQPKARASTTFLKVSGKLLFI